MPVLPTELALLASLPEYNDVQKLARANALPYRTAYAAVRSLEHQGLVLSKREGKNRVVQPADPALPGLARSVLFETPRQDLARIFHGDRLLQLHALQKLGRPELVALVTRKTRRAIDAMVKSFAAAGFLVRTSEGFKLHPRNTNYARLIEEVARLRALARLQELAPHASLLWYLGPEFIFKSMEEIDHGPVKTAGFDRFADFGVEFFSGDFRAYHYALRPLEAVDAIFEAIIVSGDTPVHRSYCALLFELKKPHDLLKRARIYDKREFAQNLADYVTKKQDKPGFLPWREHERYRSQYLRKS